MRLYVRVHDDCIDGGVRRVFMMLTDGPSDESTIGDFCERKEQGYRSQRQRKSVNSVPCGQGETWGLNAAPPRPEGDFLRPREPFPDAVGTCGGILAVPGCAGAAKPARSLGANTSWATAFWRTV